MGISFGSINTGLPKNIVQQIIAGEKIPLQQMENRKAKINNKLTLLKDLNKRVSDLRGDIFANRSARSFREMSVTSSGKGIKASVDKNVAEPGSYQVEVVQLAEKSSAITNGIEDKDETYLGVGYIQYELPNGETKDVYIDEDSSTLSGIAKLINKDSDNGMRANVVNSGDGSDEPWKLILTLEETGDDNEAIFPEIYLVDGEVDLYLQKERKAKDAKIKLDGFDLEIPANKSTELIPGVTLDFKKAIPGEELTIEISEDTAKVTEKISGIIDKLNNIIKFIKEQNSMDETTDTSQTLGGDLTLQTIESKIRSAVFTPIDTEFGPVRIGDLGVTFQRNGMLKFDPEKFKSKLDDNYEKVSQVVSGRYSIEDGKTKGFIDNLDTMVNNVLRRPGGSITSRKDGLESQVKQIDRKIDNKIRQIDRKEQLLKQKFARLEETMSRIQSQGTGLAGLGGAVNGIQQLG